jgi:hypothetical protein
VSKPEQEIRAEAISEFCAMVDAEWEATDSHAFAFRGAYLAALDDFEAAEAERFANGA